MQWGKTVPLKGLVPLLQAGSMTAAVCAEYCPRKLCYPHFTDGKTVGREQDSPKFLFVDAWLH